MPPQGSVAPLLYEEDVCETKPPLVLTPSADNRVMKIVWTNVILLTTLHLHGIYGAYLFLFKVKWLTFLFTFVFAYASGLGPTAGSHRLWSHKSYKARWPLRVLLMFLHTVTFQGTIIGWVRDHRMHHKYSETDADPHNSTRGFFFSHVGWLLVRKHPEVTNKGHTVDISDLWADPILRFQKKHYVVLMAMVSFILPTYIPTLWGESVWNAYFVCAAFRFIYTLNIALLINSLAHRWGNKPYDINIKPVESKALSFFVLGDGFHNYHHTFPWDYKTAELGSDYFNLTKVFIDMMAKIGWAYDLKTVSDDVISKRVKRTGDGSHEVWRKNDKGVPAEDKERATIVNPGKAE